MNTISRTAVLVTVVEQKDAGDGVYVPEAVARLLRASPFAEEDPEWANLHADYLDDIAAAVVRDAELDRVALEAGSRYVRGEWEKALILPLFGAERAEEVLGRLRGKY